MGQNILNDSVSSTSLKSAVEKALNYLERNELPSSWDYEALIGSNQNTSSIHLNENGDDENESSELDDFVEEEDDLDDAKSVEEKDKFVAQLFKYMEERGTPINKTPNIWGNDLDLYNLYRLVIKFGGYNRVTNKNGWKAIYNKLSLPNNEVATSANANQLRLAYKKYLLNFVDFWRKLGCTMVDTSSTTSRAGRGERNWMKTNWRTLSESSKQQSQDKDLGKPTNGRRKKSTTANETITAASNNNNKKKEDDKLSKSTTSNVNISVDEDNKKTIKRHHLKKGRKKFKLDQSSNLDDSNVNGNEPEEKYIPNDLDFESDNDYSSSTPSISKDVQVAIGDRIRVKYGKGKQLKIYEAKVMNVVNADEPQTIKYFVHYTGWNTRYDEWIKRSRIVEVVCDKSPKRRGGNKSAKNKGVPFATEEKLVVSVKTESSNNNSNTTTNNVTKTETFSTPASISGNKRGRPPNSTVSAVKNNENSNKKQQITPVVSSPIKRGRQRSECIEQDETIKKTNDNEDPSKNAETQPEETKIEQEEESNKRLKRSDQEPNSDDSTNGKTVQKVEVEKRQRKKKNDNVNLIEELAPTSKKRKASIPTITTTITNNSSSEDDSSNSSSNVINKFSKRKRISNSKYRQSVNETSTTKEPELTRKNSKDETSIKQEKSTSQDNENSEETAITKSSTNSKQEITSIPSTSTNDLLCKEEEMPASPKSSEQQSAKANLKQETLTTNAITVANDSENKTDESQSQPSSTSISSPITTTSTSTSNSQQETTAKTKTKTAATTKLCSNSEIVNNQIDKPNTESNDQNSTINENEDKKEINEDPVQFTPPTTPESLKSSSTELNDQTEPQIKDKNENNCTSSNLEMDMPSSTHGLDMIAIASGVSKLVDDLGESEAAAVAALTNTNFSPRKKRRGRGRTVSQSEREHEKSTNLSHSISNNLFNASSKDNIQQTMKENSASLAAKSKVCKTRGSLGRKVKSQNQNNLDCNSESTSHSDNFEPNSPSMLLMNTMGIGLDYNPTSKYNFCVPLDENLEQEKRIQTLQERLQDLRKTYMNIKSELAQLERRNSRTKSRQRKERSIPSSPGSAEINKTKTNSPFSTSSNSTKDHPASLHRTNSFTENSNNLEDKTDCNLTSEVC